MVKNPPANAGDTGSIQEDSTYYRAAEPMCHTAEACVPESLCSATREATAEEARGTLQLEKSPHSKKTQHSHK